MKFDRVLNGIAKYMDREIYSGMNDWQEIAARMFVARVLNNPNLETMLMNNPYIRTFAIVDSDGNVDVDGLYRDLRALVQQKGKVEISLPIFGKYTFHENDVDNLYNCIMGG